MKKATIDEVVASFLEKGGAVAANIPTERARKCLEVVHTTDELRSRFQELVTLSNDPGNFDPFSHFWGMHEDFHSIPPGHDHMTYIWAKEPCFTLLEKGSTMQHDRGVEVRIGYQEHSREGWQRMIHVRYMKDDYSGHTWAGHKRALKTMQVDTENYPLEELPKICPQAMADVHWAFDEAERKAGECRGHHAASH